MYRNFIEGKRKEDEFAKFFNKVTKSSREQDIKEHWDFNVKFDVKMLKKINRNGVPDENIHWIEIKNVRGDRGWLFGEADYFAFETEDYWAVIEKEDLQKIIKKKCTDKKIYDKKYLYKFYSRKGRNDIITMIKTLDLMAKATVIWEKPEQNELEKNN